MWAVELLLAGLLDRPGFSYLVLEHRLPFAQSAPFLFKLDSRASYLKDRFISFGGAHVVNRNGLGNIGSRLRQAVHSRYLLNPCLRPGFIDGNGLILFKLVFGMSSSHNVFGGYA